MQDRITRIVSTLAWTTTVVALASLAAALAAGPGHNAGLWDYRTGFTVLRWAAYVSMGAGIIALAVGAVAIAKRSTRVALVAAVGMGLSLLLTLPAWQLQENAKTVTRIHDITTDTANPPQFVALLAVRRTTPNGPEYGGEPIARQQRAAYPDIVPLDLAEPPARAFERALAAARAMAWDIVAADAGEGRIEATATTRWFRFKDDVVVRVTVRGDGSRIDVRSKSRLGRSDLGANANRIRAYMEKLKG